jgi:hypothetical protein
MLKVTLPHQVSFADRLPTLVFPATDYPNIHSNESAPFAHAIQQQKQLLG